MGKRRKGAPLQIDREKLKSEISSETPDYKPARDASGKWLKGSSGWTGKHEKSLSVKEFCTKLLPLTFDVATDILVNEYYAMKPAERLRLIFEVWNRAEGRVPTQLHIKADPTNPKDMNLLQIESELAKVDMQLKDLGEIANAIESQGSEEEVDEDGITEVIIEKVIEAQVIEERS